MSGESYVVSSFRLVFCVLSCHLACPKRKGRDLLTPHDRHGNALNGTLWGTPEWACLESHPLSEISRFVVDSSRSRKLVVGFVVT